MPYLLIIKVSLKREEGSEARQRLGRWVCWGAERGVEPGAGSGRGKGTLACPPAPVSASLYWHHAFFVSLSLQVSGSPSIGTKPVGFSTALGLAKCSVVSVEQMPECRCSPVLPCGFLETHLPEAGPGLAQIQGSVNV